MFEILVIAFSLQLSWSEVTLPAEVSSYLEKENPGVISFIEMQNNKKQLIHGPNCFATSLGATGVIDFHGHIEENEFGFWMHSNICKERTSGEAPVPGDIVALRQGPEGREIHAFVYLSQEIAFQKAYLQMDFMPELTTMDKVLEPYSKESFYDLRLKQDKSSYWLTLYHCQSLNEYLNKNFSSLIQQNQKFFRNLNFLQQDLAKWSFGHLASLGEINSAQGQIHNLRNELMLELAGRSLQTSWPLSNQKKSWAEAPSWLLNGLLLRLNSMDKQLNFAFLFARDELSKK